MYANPVRSICHVCSIDPGQRDFALPPYVRFGPIGSTLPIIFITGYLDIPVTVQAIKAGAADVLTKPVSSDDLLRAIERGSRNMR